MPLIEAKPEITQNYPTAASETGDCGARALFRILPSISSLTHISLGREEQNGVCNVVSLALWDV